MSNKVKLTGYGNLKLDIDLVIQFFNGNSCLHQRRIEIFRFSNNTFEILFFTFFGRMTTGLASSNRRIGSNNYFI